MGNGDYTRMLALEDEEKEKIKMNKLLEAEKAQYSVIRLIDLKDSYLLLLYNGHFLY